MTADGYVLVDVDQVPDDRDPMDPVAVVPLTSDQADWHLKQKARATGQDLTVFVRSDPGSAELFHLRFFTSWRDEIPMCTRGMMAAAQVLWDGGRVEKDIPIYLGTQREPAIARLRDGAIQLDVPARKLIPIKSYKSLIGILGREPVRMGMVEFPLYHLAEVEDEKRLLRLKPSMANMEGLPGLGLIVTSRSDTADADYVYRVFASKPEGVEDQLPGEALPILAQYWKGQLRRDGLTGRHTVTRPGVSKGSVFGSRLDESGTRVRLIGRAVTVSRNEWPAAAADAVAP